MFEQPQNLMDALLAIQKYLDFAYDQAEKSLCAIEESIEMREFEDTLPDISFCPSSIEIEALPMEEKLRFYISKNHTDNLHNLNQLIKAMEKPKA